LFFIVHTHTLLIQGSLSDDIKLKCNYENESYCELCTYCGEVGCCIAKPSEEDRRTTANY